MDTVIRARGTDPRSYIGVPPMGAAVIYGKRVPSVLREKQYRLCRVTCFHVDIEIQVAGGFKVSLIRQFLRCRRRFMRMELGIDGSGSKVQLEFNKKSWPARMCSTER